MSIERLLGALEEGRTLIFDLDDTLYAETDFLFRAYRRICSSCYGSEAELVLDFMVERFLTHGRDHLFDETLRRFPSPYASLPRFLTLLRSFRCRGEIEPYAWFQTLATRTRGELTLRIVTDGHVQQQQNKLHSLALEAFCGTLSVVCTRNFRSKPSPVSINGFADRRTFVSPVYVGDSQVDAEFAENCGFEFLDVAPLLGSGVPAPPR